MLSHFDRFYVDDGQLYGVASGMHFKVKQILYRDGKRTEVTYLDLLGEENTIVQSESGKYIPSTERYAKS